MDSRKLSLPVMFDDDEREYDTACYLVHIEARFTSRVSEDMDWRSESVALRETIRAALAQQAQPEMPMLYEDALTLAQAAAEKYPHPAMAQRAPFIDGYVAALGYPRTASGIAASGTEPTCDEGCHVAGPAARRGPRPAPQPEPEDAP